jgi:neutral ceramidase
MVLEDPRGERLALVVVDLGQVSVLLHREVAHRALMAGTGIGADRLVLSATHTHSGPGNFFAADGLNANAGRFAGFDATVTEFLVDRITKAVEGAVADLEPAKAGWRLEPVWDFTFNRSYEAYERNPRPHITVDDGLDRPVDQQAVDSTFALLRVDRCDTSWENCRPWGGFGVFAMHASNIPASNNLFDADTHGVIARSVEGHIRGGREDGGGPAYFLLGQGALGDVSANLRDPTPCRLYRFLPERAAAGPKTLPAPEAWRAPEKETGACLDAIRHEVDSLASDLGTRVSGIFDRAGDQLSSDFTLARAFTTVDLRTYEGPHPICWPPRVGAASVGGAERGFIRTWKQRVFFFDLNFKEGGSAARTSPKGCFGHKKTQLGLLVKDYTLPQVMQLGVYRLGDVLMGAVPVEPTTEVGASIRKAMLEAASARTDEALLLSITNGYALYVASAEEYQAQHYEGGSTLYGPETGQMLAHELSRLSESLNHEHPIVQVDSAKAYLRETDSHFWPPVPISPGFQREVVQVQCGKREVWVRWLDLRPGTLLPSDGPILQLEERSGDGWTLRADDSHPEIQVRAIEPNGEGYTWEARWVPRSIRGTGYRWRILPRQGLPGLVTTGCSVQSGGSS